MLNLFIGNVREGKTISMIVEAKKLYDAGYTIYTNTPVSFPHQPLSRKDLLNWEEFGQTLPPKTAFCIDEIHAGFLDSRNSQSSNNKIITAFVTQLGHFTHDKQKGLTILGTTQFFGQMDIRARRIVDKVVTCRKLEEKKDEYIIVYRKWEKNDNLNFKTFHKEIVKFGKDDFALYDTQALIKLKINDEPRVIEKKPKNEKTNKNKMPILRE